MLFPPEPPKTDKKDKEEKDIVDDGEYEEDNVDDRE